MKELKNRYIRSIEIDAEQQHFIRFITDRGDICYEAEGDCCSESWFYHILGVDALLGHSIAAIEEVDMGEVEDGKSRQEYDQLYAVKLRTENGHAEVQFRNSSNGYYGGWLRFCDGIPPGTKMVFVSEDYTA